MRANYARQVVRMVREGGIKHLLRRAARVTYRRTGAAALDFPLLRRDIIDSTTLSLPEPTTGPVTGSPLTIGWVCAPPGPRSGGHTTMFRFVEALEAAGHRCVVYLYDTFGGSTSRHEQVIRRSWPQVQAEVCDAAEMQPHDAYVATAWPTAHVLAARSPFSTRRFYLVQDYEPYFHPLGSEYVLAEDTYRFGFRHITVGAVLGRLLKEKHGVDCAVAEFGCDMSVYRYDESTDRNGVVFYAKVDVARRGFALGARALECFHQMCPDVPIHLFGDPAAMIDAPHVNHGSISPLQIAAIYNRCVAGIALSFTNLSLAPDEMLACGTVPVLNDSKMARPSLPNPHVVWSVPSPNRLAQALASVFEGSAQVRLARAKAAAASVTGGGWNPAMHAVVAAIERGIYV
jgi:O-antigen biosynthesis protein